MQGNSDTYLQEVSNQFISLIKSLQNNKNWQVKQDDGVLKVWEQQIQGRMGVKSQIKLNLPYEVVLAYFSDPFYMKHMSDNLKLFEVLYDSKTVRVIHLIVELPGPISNRELVAVNTVRVEGNRAFCGNKSCNYPINKDPDTVLAEAHVAGFILDKIDANTTLATQVSDMDVKGSIPGFIKNKLGSKRADALKNLQQKIRTHKK